MKADNVKQHLKWGACFASAPVLVWLASLLLDSMDQVPHEEAGCKINNPEQEF